MTSLTAPKLSTVVQTNSGLSQAPKGYPGTLLKLCKVKCTLIFFVSFDRVKAIQESVRQKSVGLAIIVFLKLETFLTYFVTVFLKWSLHVNCSKIIVLKLS